MKNLIFRKIYFIAFSLFVISLLSCNEELNSGLDIEVHVDVEGKSSQVGDKVIFHEKTFLNGKEMFSTYAFGAKEIVIPPKSILTKPLPPNYQVLLTMSPGDSLTVRQALKDMPDLPNGMQQNDVLTYVVKLVSIVPASDFLAQEKKK